MRIVIPTMMWKRPKVFDMFATGIQELQNRFSDVEIIVLCIGSEGEISKSQAKKYGFEYTEHPNAPLAKKAQHGTEEARKLNPDYLMYISDDDFVTPAYFAYVLDKMYQGYDYIAPYDIYFIKDMELFYWGGYDDTSNRHGEALAVGRCVSAETINRFNWELWDTENNRGLDKYSFIKTIYHAKSKHFFKCRDIGGLVVDVKSDIGLSKWNNLFARNKVSDKIEYLLSPGLYESIKKIR